MASAAKDYQAHIRLRSLPTGEWFVHQDLLNCLVTDAKTRGTNVTEVAIDILATRYSVNVSASTRKAEAGTDKEIIVLRVPIKLKLAIGAAANRAGHSLQQEIREALCAHYSLPMPAKTRRARRRAAA